MLYSCLHCFLYCVNYDSLNDVLTIFFSDNDDFFFFFIFFSFYTLLYSVLTHSVAFFSNDSQIKRFVIVLTTCRCDLLAMRSYRMETLLFFFLVSVEQNIHSMRRAWKKFEIHYDTVCQWQIMALVQCTHSWRSESNWINWFFDWKLKWSTWYLFLDCSVDAANVVHVFFLLIWYFTFCFSFCILLW